MTITLPDELKDELERKAHAAGFATIAEYVCWLVQQPESTDEEWTAADLGYASQDELEAKLLASLASPPIVVTPAFWDELRKDVAARADKMAGPPELTPTNRAELEAMLEAGINSGPPIRATPEFWEEQRRVHEERAAKRNTTSNAEAPTDS